MYRKTILFRIISALMIFLLIFQMTPSVLASETLESPITKLSSSYSVAKIKPVGSLTTFSEHWFKRDKITEKPSLGLAYTLGYSSDTTFSKLPTGYDPHELLEWGKYPGLNLDILHKYGFTGKGATIAYVDQPMDDHVNFQHIDLHNTNNSESKYATMHGNTVLSLLAGKDIGTAPEVEIYFYGHSAWKMDQTTHAECLYQIIEQNKNLPKKDRITMVGFSDGIDPSEKNADAFREATAACEEAGIMVWFCQEYGSAAFLPLSDRNNPENMTTSSWSSSINVPLVFVPGSGRTAAGPASATEYIYWSDGGLSWTMPYMLGLYAIVYEIDPTLTQDDIRTLVVETAYTNSAGMRIVNPVEFVCAALDRVGRTKEAKAMRAEVKARESYIYALVNTSALSTKDLDAIGSYLATLTDGTVLVCDTSTFEDAASIYEAIKADAAERGGRVAGIQIFGTSALVPAFSVKYVAQMIDGIDEMGSLLTDLFYSNFNNDVELIGSDYSVYRHFKEGLNVDLVPQWPVVRLPLEKGEYKAFFKKYKKFAKKTGLENQTIVNFSNPIFQSSNSTDDMGVFLTRMDTEFRILKTDYRLYANQDGDYPVKRKSLGNFTAANLTKENKRGIMELIINTHGQWNNFDRCIFKNGKEIRESLMNMDNINDVLGKNFYYLDAWACNNGTGMGDNIVTTALNGKCVGMFAATHVISNNGVNNKASVETMKQSNFYYFYYNYLKALNEGNTRSTSFFLAQNAYAEALLEDSKNGIRSGEGNYQFNLHNLLDYTNFGVIEPNLATLFMYDSKGLLEQTDEEIVRTLRANKTKGEPTGESGEIRYSVTPDSSDAILIKSYTYERLDNGHTRYTIVFEAPYSSYSTFIFNPPNGSDIGYRSGPVSGNGGIIIYDLKDSSLEKVEGITVYIGSDEEDAWVYFSSMQQSQ